MTKPVLLITGSSGFIGAAVSCALADRFEIVGLDRDEPPLGLPLTWLRVDLRSDESVGAALERVRRDFGNEIASVVHLAAYYDFSGEPSSLYDEITVRGTKRLLDSLSGFTVGQIIFSSTMLVHAPCRPGQRINEDWPVEPKWEYPQSKLDTERLIEEQRGTIPAVHLRIAGVYDDHCHSIPIANQIQRIYERRLTGKVFPGDTSTGQAFVHLADLSEAVVLATVRRSSLPASSTILIGEPETLSYDELQRTLAWLIHGDGDWDTTRVPKRVAKTGAWVQDKIPGIEDPFIKPWMIDLADDHYALDISRARKLLGWHPDRSLRATLPRMVELLKRDPAAFYAQNGLSSGELRRPPERGVEPHAHMPR